MASTARDAPDEEGVEFIHEDDGSITAKDLETGVASFGNTKADPVGYTYVKSFDPTGCRKPSRDDSRQYEALRMLAEAIEIHEGGGEPLTECRPVPPGRSPTSAARRTSTRGVVGSMSIVD